MLCCISYIENYRRDLSRRWFVKNRVSKISRQLRKLIKLHTLFSLSRANKIAYVDIHFVADELAWLIPTLSLFALCTRNSQHSCGFSFSIHSKTRLYSELHCLRTVSLRVYCYVFSDLYYSSLDFFSVSLDLMIFLFCFLSSSNRHRCANHSMLKNGN